ncbi:type IV pilus modification protein PilV [Legionella sp. km772]|uniref:type IV pilus modification protein PilV n=1 Tax=Legionella sp. km772 TaxID=2498111 RepID=UPI000F8CED2B|nr:type IV pilus modification protein PilV [Legionella sp. km772]
MKRKLNVPQSLIQREGHYLFVNQKGISLLEVLVSVIIIAIGMLGIASMLLVSNQANNSSYMKQQAIQNVYNIFDKIRANSQAAVNGNYNISNIGSTGLPTAVTTPAVMCNAAACTPAQLATYDTWTWLTKDLSRLPNGCGSITTAPSPVAGNTTVTVTVQWDDSPAQNSVGTNSQISTVNANFVQIRIQSQI